MIHSIGIRTSRQMLRSQTRFFKSVTPLLNSSTTSSTVSESPKLLTWEEFLKLRKQERRINFGSSIFSSFIGSITSWGYISQVEIDPTQMIFGMDPFVVMMGGMAAGTLLGFLLGPLLGGGIFNIKNRRILNEYYEKQKTFLKHIIKNRADPSRNSFQNPVPDYYGEKIGSLKEYRTWLRDCNAYKKKAQEFL